MAPLMHRRRAIALAAGCVGILGLLWIRADARDARVIALPQPDWSLAPAGAAFGDLDTTAGRIERFNAIAREEAGRAGADWVDLFPLMREQGRLGSFAPDGLHPSADAYAAWARRLAEIAS